jgi:hypothetical protein
MSFWSLSGQNTMKGTLLSATRENWLNFSEKLLPSSFPNFLSLYVLNFSSPAIMLYESGLSEQIYLGALLTLAQRLALMRTVSFPHTTLTSLHVHDQVAAWNGLGAALGAIRDQFRLRSAFPRILCIAIYLGAVTVLGSISTPALFSIDSFETYDENFDKLFATQGIQAFRPSDVK